MAINRRLRLVHRALALPLLPHKHQETEFCQGCVNPDHTLKTQDIEELGAVYYTLIEPDLICNALSLSERNSAVLPAATFDGRGAHRVFVVRRQDCKTARS